MQDRRRWLSACCAFGAWCGGAAVVTAGDLEVIFSEVPGDPSATVPGAVDPDGDPIDVEFTALELLSVAHDGVTWIVKARSNAPDTLDTILLLGENTTGSMLAQEGQPIPGGAPGEEYEFFGSGPARFNEVGQFCYTARARGGDSAVKQKGIVFDGNTLQVVRQESDPANGLLDLPPNPSGDELFGNSFGSMHVLNDGIFSYQDSTIKNIHSTRRPALFYNDQAFIQSGVTAIGERLWDSLDANDFLTTPDGETWVALGDDDGPDDSDDILVVNNDVVLREGSAVPGSAIIVGAVFNTNLAASGDWFSRGDDPADDDWAVRNGVVVAATGETIFVGADEHWGDAFLAFNGNTVGDWVMAGRTDEKDAARNEVLVLNGAEVLAREGDQVDLDGNGRFDDDAFIGRGNPDLSAFGVDDLAISDDGVVYFFAHLRSAAGQDLGAGGLSGDVFIRLAPDSDCPQDLDGDGDVGFTDLLSVLAAWGPCPGCDQDFDASGDVGFTDLLTVLAAWGPCP